MKLMLVARTAKSCGMVVALLTLAFSPVLLAQPFPPYFSPLAPVVRITSPANHTTFYTPVDIPIFAFAREALVTYTNVEFYAASSTSTNDLGPGFCLSSTNRSPGIIYPPFAMYRLAAEPRVAAMYCFVWTNAPAGSYALTAVARGLENALEKVSRTSAPVNVTILTAITNQNPADVVSIVATDPVAIAGTNAYWVWEGVTNATPSWTNWPPKHWQLFTNWGPKNATFTVRRFGSASTNLTVNYNLGGTASNGVDYVALPGNVTIPAGAAYALIPVVPMDNNVTNYSATVILSLQGDTNAPPEYTVGYPSRAAALILDYWPRAVPIPFLLSDRSFHLNATGPDGAWFSVQSSGNLLNWSSVSTNQVVNGSIDFIDPNPPNNSSGFYRAMPLTNAPAN